MFGTLRQWIGLHQVFSTILGLLLRLIVAGILLFPLLRTVLGPTLQDLTTVSSGVIFFYLRGTIGVFFLVLHAPRVLGGRTLVPLRLQGLTRHGPTLSGMTGYRQDQTGGRGVDTRPNPPLRTIV